MQLMFQLRTSKKSKMAEGIPAEVEIDGKNLTIITDNFELHYNEDGRIFSAENLK